MVCDTLETSENKRNFNEQPKSVYSYIVVLHDASNKFSFRFQPQLFLACTTESLIHTMGKE